MILRINDDDDNNNNVALGWVRSQNFFTEKKSLGYPRFRLFTPNPLDCFPIHWAQKHRTIESKLYQIKSNKMKSNKIKSIVKISVGTAKDSNHKEMEGHRQCQQYSTVQYSIWNGLCLEPNLLSSWHRRFQYSTVQYSTVYGMVYALNLTY